MKNDNRVYVQEEQVGVRFFCPRCFYAVAEIPETRLVSRHCANCGHPLEWPTFDDEGAMVQSPKDWNSGGSAADGKGEQLLKERKRLDFLENCVRRDILEFDDITDSLTRFHDYWADGCLSRADFVFLVRTLRAFFLCHGRALYSFFDLSYWEDRIDGMISLGYDVFKEADFAADALTSLEPEEEKTE